MSVYVMGDTHGGFQRFSTTIFRMFEERLVVQWERISKVKA